MKFKSDYDVKPSQEFLMTIISVMFWAPVLLIFATMTLSSIKDWIKKMTSKKRSISDQLRSMSSEVSVSFEVTNWNDEPIIEGNDYPRADWTDAKNGKHWEVDEDVLKDPECKLGDTFLIYQIDYVVSMTKKIDGLITFLSGVSKFDNAATDIDKYLRSNFKQEELQLEEAGSYGELVFKNAKLVRVKWPNAEQFKNPVASVKKIQTAGGQIEKKLDILADKYDALMAGYDENTTDKKLALGAASYIKVCSELVGYVGALNDLVSWCFPCLNNDEVEGCALKLVDKEGNDITDHH